MTKKLRLLDTFCGAGGAGMGYHRAGFEVIGVDINPQPRYPFEFHQGDALEFIEQYGREFDVIHASPPCQAYSKATAWRGNRKKHPDLINDVRRLLLSSGKPYIIENVEDARSRLINPIMLCGSTFNLSFRRHRYFEAPCLPLILVPPCHHKLDDMSFDHGNKQPESAYRDEIGCDWMTVIEARQAIPPAYTEWLGKQILKQLELEAVG